MPEAAGGIAGLNWPALVSEAVRRRKAEKMTQREHAALAGVSIPTMIAFDRGARTLSLAKAIDILRVVGLAEEASSEGSQEAFVGDAFARWRDLIRDLPQDSPGRFPAGWYRIDYAIEGGVRDITLRALQELLRKAVIEHTGWPMFRVPGRSEPELREVEGMLECWLRPGGERPYACDAAHCDFWRASPSGRLVLIRGYQEDAQETFPPGVLFDTTLPIWRIGEAFLHAARLATLIARDPAAATIRLRVFYTGLRGRDLRAWASPMSVDHFGGGRSRSDEAMLEGAAPAAVVAAELGPYVLPLVASLFERFGVTGISAAFVRSELERMRRNRFGV